MRMFVLATNRTVGLRKVSAITCKMGSARPHPSTETFRAGDGGRCFSLAVRCLSYTWKVSTAPSYYSSVVLLCFCAVKPLLCRGVSVSLSSLNIPVICRPLARISYRPPNPLASPEASALLQSSTFHRCDTSYIRTSADHNHSNSPPP